jgi:sensor c-di-GMP phosphodiesterase-like protein
MKRILKQRVLLTLFATVLAAAGGMAGGYLLGGALAIRQARHLLDLEATRLIAIEDTALKETYATLKKMSASPYPRCSAAEVAYFRKLIYGTDYIWDGGRMHDGLLDCSVMLAPADFPAVPMKPMFSMPRGTKIYHETGTLQLHDRPTFRLQLGDLYVVINPGAEVNAESTPLPFTMSLTPGPNRIARRLMDSSAQPDDAAFNTEGPARINETLYFTRCTPDQLSCVTTHTTISEAMRADRRFLWLCMTMGMLVGAVIGFLCSLLYHRSRGLEKQLRRAIARDELRLVYQPIVDIASGRIVGAEALARWNDEAGVAVGPDVFIKIAEEHGFVGEITQLVARHALHDFGETLRTHPDFQLSINVAASDLSDDHFMPMLTETLEDAGVSAKNLAIEITESSTASFKAAVETTHRLHQRGHSVHIDDFGTGYSSLSYLHDLSADAIKIDKSFVRSIGTEAVTVVILPQILAMAKALDLQVIVEGIETGQQASFFADKLQHIFAQGWFYGRPTPPEDFKRLLAEDEKKAAAD